MTPNAARLARNIENAIREAEENSSTGEYLAILLAVAAEASGRLQAYVRGTHKSVKKKT
jgi:type III secretory pathway component EscV